MSSVAITNPATRQGKCEEWPNCYHTKARYTSNCQGCHHRVNKEDCITHNKGGWTHVECPGKRSERERGLPAVESDFNKSVDYGNSYLARITMGEGQCLSPTHSQPRIKYYDTVQSFQLEDDFDAEADSNAKSTRVTQDEEKIVERDTKRSSAPLEECEFEEKPNHSAKKTKHNEKSPTSVVTLLAYDTNENGADYEQEKRTHEQMKILQHNPEQGEVVVVNALAGCGKTTTIALLCDKVRQENPDDCILYLVYNAAIQNEAMQCKKFPKENTEIRTTHAYVLRHYFGIANMHSVKPAGDYTLKSIIDELDLTEECKQMFQSNLPGGAKGEKALQKRVKSIAGYIIKTLNKYQASDKPHAMECHVPYQAKVNSKRAKWRQQIRVIKYVNWANQVFETVQQKCIDLKCGNVNQSEIEVTHDGYIKVAQLEQLHIDFDYIFIDEAQDMSACQADLFWGQHQRNDKRIYLFGDRYQQIYRFRGASKSFRDMVDESNRKFSLTGSFRFGVKIAACATTVLKALGGEVLCGRSHDDGKVEEFIEDGEQPSMKKGVVLCRTQNGIFRYLFTHRPSRWCNLSGKCDIPLSPKSWQLELEQFVVDKLRKQEEEQENESENEEESSNENACNKDSVVQFVYKGEKFKSIEEIYEYTEEEEDVELCKAVNLLVYLSSKNKSLTAFYSDLRRSYYEMKETESPEKYDGVVVITTHKAKGLEWQAPVLIYDDFKFKAILSAVANAEKHCDEANILYVAITRAKRHLYLTREAKLCLEQLSKMDHVKLELPAMMSSSMCEELFAKWKDVWEYFKGHTNAINSIDDVPFPPLWSDENFPLALHPAMSVIGQRKQLRQYLRVYHPDKFISAIRMHTKSVTVLAELKNTVEEITRKCTDLLASLQDEDGGGTGGYD